MKRTFALAALAVCATSAFAQFNDTFDSIDPAWTNDRYAPAGFSSEFFDGDNRLKLTISPSDSWQNRPGAYQSAFYNTQGKVRNAGNLATNWTVSGSVYISNDMLSSTNNWRTDIWTRDNEAVENNAWYGIFGAKRFDDADSFNEAATNKTNAWRIWDADTVNGWVTLGDAVTAGWNDLAISSNGTSAQYFLNGNLVYTDADVASTDGALRSVFVQAYNFGNASTMPSGAYSVYWDNVNAVPEPASMAIVAGIAALVARKKRKA